MNLKAFLMEYQLVVFDNLAISVKLNIGCLKKPHMNEAVMKVLSDTCFQ